MAESTDKVALGVLTGMEPRSNGWFRFSVHPDGKQYPIKLDTKKPELVEQAKALMGTRVKVMYGEQLSENINPHTNEPYTNRYLNNIAGAQEGDFVPAGQADTNGAVTNADAVQQAPQGQMRPDQKKELRIMREVGAKLAVDMAAAGLIPQEQQTVAGLVEVSEVWVAYFAYGPARFGVQAFNHVDPTPPPPPPPPLPADDFQGADDDIPF